MNVKQQEERIESLKSGVISATTLAGAALLTTATQAIALSQGEGLSPALLESWLGWASLLKLGNAAVAGLLFGVTYRYIIRQDENSHLKSGAVLAFGLVRGLAQVELGLTLQVSLPMLVVLAAESILMFAIARVVLDWAIAQGIVKPFSLMD